MGEDFGDGGDGEIPLVGDGDFEELGEVDACEGIITCTIYVSSSVWSAEYWSFLDLIVFHSLPLPTRF